MMSPAQSLQHSMRWSLRLFCLHCLVLPVSGRSMYSCGGLNMMLLRTINPFLHRGLVLHASFTKKICRHGRLTDCCLGDCKHCDSG